jgi:hypothetical protein
MYIHIEEWIELGQVFFHYQKYEALLILEYLEVI